MKKDIVVKTPIPQIVKEETKATGGEIITPSPQFTPQFTPQISNNIEPIESIKDIHIPPDNLNSLEEVSINSLLSGGTNNIEMPELIVDEIDFL